MFPPWLYAPARVRFRLHRQQSPVCPRFSYQASQGKHARHVKRESTSDERLESAKSSSPRCSIPGALQYHPGVGYTQKKWVWNLSLTAIYYNCANKLNSIGKQRAAVTGTRGGWAVAKLPALRYSLWPRGGLCRTCFATISTSTSSVRDWNKHRETGKPWLQV